MPAPRPYITASRLEHLRRHVTSQDLDVLASLRKVRVLSGLQIQRLHHGPAGDDAARQRRICATVTSSLPTSTPRVSVT